MHFDGLGKFALGKVAAIAAFGAHRHHVGGAAAPQPGGMSGARKLDGERGSPGAGTEYGDRLVRQIVVGRAHFVEESVARRVRPISSPPFARVGLRRLLRHAAREQRVEIHRRQQKLREATLRDEVRHRRARVREQHARADARDGARFTSGSPRFFMTKMPACFTSTRKSVVSPCLADTVTVRTTSRTSVATGFTPVCRSRLICGFHLPFTRGPFGRLVGAVLEIDALKRELGRIRVHRRGRHRFRSCSSSGSGVICQRGRGAGGVEIVQIVAATDVLSRR